METDGQIKNYNRFTRLILPGEYAFNNWFSYLIWQFRHRNYNIEIIEEPRWEIFNGRKMLIAKIIVSGNKHIQCSQRITK